VWRDGQRKKVYVYRFLAAGTLEEKVFQRQLSKKGLQTIVVEEGDEATALSSEDLRNLFQVKPDTPSDTHDMLRCTRCRKPDIEEGESDGELERINKEEEEARGMANETVKGAAPPSAAADARPDNLDNDCLKTTSEGASCTAARSKKTSKGKVQTGSGVQKERSAGRGEPKARPTKRSRYSAYDEDQALMTALEMSRKEAEAVAGSASATAVPIVLDDEHSDASVKEEREQLPAPLAKTESDTASERKLTPLEIAAKSRPLWMSIDAGEGKMRTLDGTRSSPAAVPVVVAVDDPQSKAASAAENSESPTAPASPSAECADVEHFDLDADDDIVDPFEDEGLSVDDGFNSEDDDVPIKKKGSNKSASAKKQGGSAAAKQSSKAAQQRAEKMAQQQRKEFEDALASAIKNSLSKPLDPVEPGTVRRQLKYPGEDEIRAWSHHCGCSTVADDVLKDCGQDLVSFVFGLEVRGKDLSHFADKPTPAAAPKPALSSASSLIVRPSATAESGIRAMVPTGMVNRRPMIGRMPMGTRGDAPAGSAFKRPGFTPPGALGAGNAAGTPGTGAGVRPALASVPGRFNIPGRKPMMTGASNSKTVAPKKAAPAKMARKGSDSEESAASSSEEDAESDLCGDDDDAGMESASEIEA
jgi:hypothetical protein